MALRSFLFALIITLCTNVTSWADNSVNLPDIEMPEPITANVAEDFDPSLSRDGRYLAFVSTRDQNTDIWLKIIGEKNIETWLKILRGKDGKGWFNVLKEGVLFPTTLFRLTTDTSTDTSPALSPDGKTLAFVSTRSDPKGDIYFLEISTLPLDNPQPIRLTGIETADNDPAFSPDGKILAYTSAPSATDPENIWFYDIAGKKHKQLTSAGGFSPAFSPDGDYLVYVVREEKNIGGDLVVMRLADKKTVLLIRSPVIEAFPTWDDEGKAIFFVRYAEDTDGDGKITVQDRSDLYSVPFSQDIFEGAPPPPPKQLTSTDTYDLFPCVNREKLYFSSSRPGRDQEIYVMNKEGIILFPYQENIVKEIQKSYPDKKYLPLLALANYIQDESVSKNLLARAMYEKGVLYQESIGNLIAAGDEFQKLISRYPYQYPYPDLARIRLARIEVELSQQVDRKKAEGLISQKIEELSALAQNEKILPEVRGKALLTVGDFYGMLTDISSALSSFIEVTERFGSSPDLAAQALFHAGEIYRIFKQDIDKVQGAYLKIITDYPQQSIWVDRAASAIIDLAQEKNMDKSIANLREVQEFYPKLSLLVAKAKNKIGSLYEETGRINQAKIEYAGIIQNFIEQKNEVDDARFSLARIYYKQNDFENCLEIYHEIERNTSEREQIYRAARQNLIRRSLEKAKREFLEGEPRLSIKSYLRLIEYDDSILEAHRGLMRVYASIKEIDRVTERFRKRSEEEPKNFIPHYVLGLALTYLDPPDLNGAEESIKKSLALHFRSPYPHQTLGWIYEQREQVGGEGNFYEQALSEYQIALSLNRDDPLNQANLYANIGNCYYQLKSFHLAYHIYKKRAVYPFDDSAAESIFYQRFGDTAFKAGKSDEAIDYYKRAMKNARKANDINRLALLCDKLGLSSQDRGDFKAAAQYFTESLAFNRKLKNLSNIPLLLRNIAYNFYYLSRQEEQKKNLKAALDYYQQSLKQLKYKTTVKDSKGLFQIALKVGTDKAESAEGFDLLGEEKLITTYIGRIYKDSRNQQNALKYLEKKISLLARDWEKSVSLAAERSIVLNQAGTLAFSLGDYLKALDYFINSFHIAEKLENKTGMVKNAINIAQVILAHREELSYIIPKSIPKVLKALETIGAEPRYFPQRIMLNNSLALLWYYAPAFTIQSDSDKEQIEKSLWELKREALPPALLKEALELIDKVADKKTISMYKVILLANLALVTSPGAESASYLLQALDMARQNHLDNIQWRLMLEKALSENNVTLLAESAKILETIPLPESESFPGDRKRIEDLYGSLILQRAKEEDWEDTFNLSERYRTQVYLRTSERGAVSSHPDRSDINLVQQYLEPYDLLVKYEQVKGKTFWWRVDKNSFAGGRLASLPQALISAPQEEDVEKFLEPISLTGIRRLYLIVPPSLTTTSWESAIINKQPLIKQVALIHLKGLRHFLDAYQARNLTPLKLFLAEKEKKINITDIFIDTDVWAKEKDFITQAGRWSLLHLNLPMEEDYPLPRWILPTRLDIGNRLSPADFSTGKTGKQLVVFFPKSPATAARTAGELSAAGFPSALAYFGPQKTKKDFFHTFYNYLSQNTPAEALRSTLTELEDKFPKEWACASLYGFGGMNQDEKQQFARQRFSTNLKKGITAFRNKNWNQAIGYLEEVLVMMDVLGTVKNRDKIYRALVDSFFFLNNYSSAIDNQKKLVAYYRDQQKPDWEVLADARYQLGVLYSRAENYEGAASELSAALKIYREYQITDKIARSYGTLGVIEESASDYGEALKNFEAALKQNKELEDVQGVGQQMRRLGRIYYLRLNNYAKAESMFQKAREIFRKTGDKQQVIETTLELGLVRERMADFHSALIFYKEGYDLAKSTENNLMLSKAAVYMANIAWFQGDYQTAFTHQREALNLAEKAKDLRQQQIAHNLAGLIYWTLNDHEKALKYLNLALDLAKTIKSKIDIATAYNNIGLAFREKKDYLTAIEHFKNALAIDQSIGSRWGEGYDYRNLGIAYLRQKDFVEAGRNLEAAIRISGEISNHINRVKALLEMGNLTYETGDYPTSRQYLEEAALLSEKLVIPEVRWRSLMRLGELAETEEKSEQALNFYSQAIKVVEQMRATIKIEEFKNGFLSNKADLYDKMILLLIRQGKTKEAFNMSERSRARSFIDLLGNRQIIFKDNVSQELFERRQSLKNRILAVEKALSAKEDETQRLAKDLADLRGQYEELLIEIKQQNPQLSAFVTVDPLTYQDVRSILEENVALLEYYLTESHLLIWVVKKNFIKVLQVQVNKDSIKKSILDYRLLLQNLEAHQKPSYALYRLLIEPVEDDIEGTQILGIVPHGPLHYLAFASLWDSNAYLAEKFPLFYVPSASVLKFVSHKKRTAKSEVRVLAVGNPDLGSFNYDLPLAEMEVESMKWDFPKVDILIREKATESWVIKNISRYDIIHFATHGEFDAINPLFSALKLTGEANYDGNLEVDEVFSLNLKANMVTLSACQTGLGKILSGDDIVGLNRAFIYAGTRSILSALWRVSDLATAVLIKHFYRNYSHLSKAESLQKAQILLMKYFSHPSYWAGLSLTGDYH